jgi:hypothetical protein
MTYLSSEAAQDLTLDGGNLAIAAARKQLKKANRFSGFKLYEPLIEIGSEPFAVH